MELRLSETFEAPASAVWQIMGCFYRLETWFPGVTSCDRDDNAWGEVRKAYLGDWVTPERLEFYDNAAMTIAWSLPEAPLLGEHRSTLKITSLGDNRCHAEWVFCADPQPPLDAEKIEQNTAKMYGGALAEVRRRVEGQSGLLTKNHRLIVI